MFPFKRKQKIPSHELGKVLAKFTLRLDANDTELGKLFGGDTNLEGERFWIEENILYIYITCRSLLTHFKGAKSCYKLIDYYRQWCCDILSERGNINENLELMNIIIKRIEEYDKAFSNEKEPGRIHWVGKKICEFHGVSYNDIAKILPSGMFFSEALIGTKKMIDSLMKTFKINENSNFIFDFERFESMGNGH
ncbi:hypothetical protein D3OALGA1CA_1990 [Olavius algarvensis associated proteobacterium Delta 3]|nr:hypothetical protein D3OALGA1CA_1990 [Olavius algarvensis associated proteobacterium Delta 3]CAB5119396.1 hypothetical protein D3OALGB2SA_2884 [Olavius algarvensis associated proteobacterium Delta 3]